MKPGPAISTFATRSLAGSAATIACASSRGLRFAAFASCIAMLLAKSPWVASRVRSIVAAPGVMSSERSSSGKAASASRTRFSIRYFKMLPSGGGPARAVSLGNYWAAGESKT
jgi:hypothetical protein